MAEATPPVRHFGRVVHYDSRPREHYGFVVDLGNWGDGDVVEGRIYFHATRVRRQACTAPKPMVKFCDGDIVEYCLEVKENDGETSYRAYDITGLNEGYLPFHKGVITFTPYHVALRKLAKQEVASGQAHFGAIQAVHTTEVEKEERLERKTHKFVEEDK